MQMRPYEASSCGSSQLPTSPSNRPQLPPPSSPQAHSKPLHQNSVSGLPSLQPSSLPSGSREMPSLPPVHGAGSKMPISSMLGLDTGRPTYNPAQTNTTGNSFSQIAASIPSPRWQSGLSTSISSPQVDEQAGFISPKSQSPERVKVSLTQTSANPRAFSGAAQRHPFTRAPTDTREFPLKRLPTGSLFSPKSDSGPQQERGILHDRYLSPGRLVERPSSQPSQPSGYRLPHGCLEDRLRARPATSEAEGLLQTQGVAKGLRGLAILEGSEKQQAVRAGHASTDYSDKRTQGSRGGPLPNSATLAIQAPGLATTSSYPFFNRKSNTPDSQRPRKKPKTESSINRVLDREQHQPQPPYTEEYLRRLREERLVQQSLNLAASNQESRSIQQGGDIQGQIHPRNQHLAVPSIDGSSHAHSLDQPLRPEEENLQTQRGSLAHLLSDRRGRVSPLPQAVQGAQDRLSGPASDPGIKSEFARMFIGIGSGAGSAGRIASESSSPFPPNPTRTPDVEGRSPLIGLGDCAELAKASADFGGDIIRESHKTEEAKPGNDEGEGPNTSGPSGTRGIKRGRHNHHHHHPHNHLHRHDERSRTPITNLANPKRVTTPSQLASNLPAGSHHHHHHHRHHHHHHHCHIPRLPVVAPVTGSVPLPVAPLRFPTTSVHSKHVLESIQHLPRHHIGSRLYHPSQQHNPALSQAAQLDTLATPEQEPQFEGKENCTVTIRIPRFYLTNTEREKICSRRAVWGVDVYTDDSDPLAAAIHSGWIQGHWGADVDASMLEMKIIKKQSTDGGKPKAVMKATVYTAVPPEPLIPITGKDLHLTLLILPSLQKYASLVRHGIKSRYWNKMYSGMSFMIERIAWIEGGAGNGEERGGEARRRRIKILQSMGSGAPVSFQ